MDTSKIIQKPINPLDVQRFPTLSSCCSLIGAHLLNVTCPLNEVQNTKRRNGRITDESVLTGSVIILKDATLAEN